MKRYKLQERPPPREDSALLLRKSNLGGSRVKDTRQLVQRSVVVGLSRMVEEVGRSRCHGGVQ